LACGPWSGGDAGRADPGLRAPLASLPGGAGPELESRGDRHAPGGGMWGSEQRSAAVDPGPRRAPAGCRGLGRAVREGPLCPRKPTHSRRCPGCGAARSLFPCGDSVRMSRTACLLPRLTKLAAALAMLTALACFPSPAAAQQPQERLVAAKGTHIFRRILHDLQCSPLDNVE